MFSSNALASSTFSFSIRWFVALCLALVPQVVAAQTGGGSTGGSDDEPPPFWYRPGPVTDDPSSLDTFICRTTATDGSGALYCAGEISFGGRTSLALTGGEPSLYTFALDTHETVRFESAGALDTRGELLDAGGVSLAANDNGADGRNFRMTRTLGPGRYYVKVTGVGGAAGPTALLMERTLPRHRGARVSLDELAGDAGNHCGSAVGIAAFSRSAGVFERAGDVDVFAVELGEASQLLIDVEGDARYELKAGDCTRSIGLAAATFGATLVDLTEGTYYLYVSQGSSAAKSYAVNLEIR